MQVLEVDKHGLTEIGSDEANEINGGVIWPLVAIGAAFVISAINNWGDIREGWEDGAPGGTPRH